MGAGDWPGELKWRLGPWQLKTNFWRRPKNLIEIFSCLRFRDPRYNFLLCGPTESGAECSFALVLLTEDLLWGNCSGKSPSNSGFSIVPLHCSCSSCFQPSGIFRAPATSGHREGCSGHCPAGAHSLAGRGEWSSAEAPG